MLTNIFLDPNDPQNLNHVKPLTSYSKTYLFTKCIPKYIHLKPKHKFNLMPKPKFLVRWEDILIILK